MSKLRKNVFLTNRNRPSSKFQVKASMSRPYCTNTILKHLCYLFSYWLVRPNLSLNDRKLEINISVEPLVDFGNVGVYFYGFTHVRYRVKFKSQSHKKG